MIFNTILVTDINKLRIYRMFKFSANSKKHMIGVNADLITIFNEALKYSPIDFGVPFDGGLRTVEQQAALFECELTKCDGVNDISNHQTGNALDIYAYLGSASWDKSQLAIIAGVILSTANRLRQDGLISTKIKWGGEFGSDSFNGWDYPHFEIVI